jgi:predicted transposase/invertase (TIGR01784 family)
MDHLSEYFGAYEEGIEKGRKEGRKETALETATAVIKKNLPLEDIAEITDLSLDEVKQLAASLKD